MKDRFEHATTSLGLLVDGGKRVIDYVIDKKKAKKEDKE